MVIKKVFVRFGLRFERLVEYTREGTVANKLKGSESTARTSITFAQNTYESLEKIANLKRVSIAWVVREAVESYLNTEKNVPIRYADHE